MSISSDWNETLGEAETESRPGWIEPAAWYASFVLIFLASVYGGGMSSPVGALGFMVTLSLGVAAAFQLGLLAAVVETLLLGLVLMGGFLAGVLDFTDEGLFDLAYFGLFGLTTFAVALGFGYQSRSVELAQRRGNLLSKIFNTLPIGIRVCDGDGRAVYVNERWASLAESSGGESVGSNLRWSPVRLSEDLEHEIKILPEADAGAVTQKEVELVDKNGRKCVVTLLTTRVFIDSLEAFGTLSLMIDETSLRYVENQIRLNEHRLQSALNNAGIGFWDEDLESRKIFADRNWFEILGVGEDERGDPRTAWQRRLHTDDRKTVEAAYDALKRDTQRETMEIDYRVERGRSGTIWVRDRVSVSSRGQNGTPSRIMGVFHDISKQKEDEIELKLAKDRAEAASAAKGQFLATVSHEIRTPLNAIIGLSGFLTESALDEEQRDLAQTIHASGEGLLLLVNDILDFSKIEAGRLELETQEFPLRLSFEDSVKLFKVRASEKGVAMTLEMENELPEYALGDMERLRQIVNNLLANALKFTEVGEIRLEVRRAALDDLPPERRPDPHEPVGFLDQADSDYIEVVVRDTGIGIASARQAALFDAFSQADPSTTRKYGGTGLGLAICKRLVLAMGGRIWVDSEEGKGANFGFVVRTKFIHEGAEAEQPIHAPLAPSERIADQHPGEILVVGPPEEAETVLSSCRKLGYAPHYASAHDFDVSRYIGRFYDIVFIWIDDEARSLGLARTMRARKGGVMAGAIIGLSTGVSQKLTPERCKLNGMERLIEVEPGPPRIREIILDVLTARG